MSGLDKSAWFRQNSLYPERLIVDILFMAHFNQKRHFSICVSYNARRSNYINKEDQVLPDMTPTLMNCNSKNFKAIAQANLSTFGILNIE